MAVRPCPWRGLCPIQRGLQLNFFYCGEDDIGIDAFLCVQLIYIYIYIWRQISPDMRAVKSWAPPGRVSTPISPNISKGYERVLRYRRGCARWRSTRCSRKREHRPIEPGRDGVAEGLRRRAV